MIVSMCILLNSKSVLKLVSKGLSAQKQGKYFEGNRGREWGSISKLQQQGKLVNTTFSGGREHTTTVFPFFLESGYSPVTDSEEGAAGPGPLLIFGPNLGPKGRKNFFGRPPPPPLPQGLDPALHFIRI